MLCMEHRVIKKCRASPTCIGSISIRASRCIPPRSRTFEASCRSSDKSSQLKSIVLAAQSSVGLSFEQPVETIESILAGTLNILEAVRFFGIDAKLYSACTSECFGDTGATPADETTAFKPCSPYGVAKAAAYWLVSNYRQAYHLFACSGILFNHESPLRPAQFVTQKIVRGVVDVAQKNAEVLELGNLQITRDWGWAPEYVHAMWRMLQQDKAEDFVIATGVSFTLEAFVAYAFAYFDLDWRQYVRVRDDLFRTSDIQISAGIRPRLSASLAGRRRRPYLNLFRS